MPLPRRILKRVPRLQALDMNLMRCFININAAPSKLILGYNLPNIKTSSLFSRISYNVKDKYLLNLHLRRDGSQVLS